MRDTPGGVKGSTGVLSHDKRVEARTLFKIRNLNLNANNNKLAYAA